MSYEGFISTVVKSVLGIKTNRGHGFEVRHAPDEGMHHAEVSYKEGEGGLQRIDKAELRLALQKVFGPLLSHQCDPATTD